MILYHTWTSHFYKAQVSVSTTLPDLQKERNDAAYIISEPHIQYTAHSFQLLISFTLWENRYLCRHFHLGFVSNMYYAHMQKYFSILFPSVNISQCDYFPVWLFPSVIISQSEYFPVWIFPSVIISQCEYFPVWIFSSVNISQCEYFPEWIFPSVIISQCEYFPV